MLSNFNEDLREKDLEIERLKRMVNHLINREKPKLAVDRKCPVCGKRVYKTKKYCGSCGQKIRWI